MNKEIFVKQNHKNTTQGDGSVATQGDGSVVF